MKFIKHIGRHSTRKVAIVYRTVPDETHMCLTVYPETLPNAMHDAIMKVIESDIGQQSSDLADALHRSLLNDGRPILETLHAEGLLKKVPTNQIIVTPNAQSHVRLDELNKILDGLEVGDKAAEDMRKLDEGAGLVDPNASKPAGRFNEKTTEDLTPVDVTDMSDEGIANQRMAQAERMAAEAKSMLAESERLISEAKTLNPSLKSGGEKTQKKSTPVETTKASVNEDIVPEVEVIEAVADSIDSMPMVEEVAEVKEPVKKTRRTTKKKAPSKKTSTRKSVSKTSSVTSTNT